MVQFYERLIVERCYFPDFLITRNLPVASHRPSANVTCLKVKVGKEVLAGESSFTSRKPKTGRPVKPGLEPGMVRVVMDGYFYQSESECIEDRSSLFIDFLLCVLH